MTTNYSITPYNIFPTTYIDVELSIQELYEVVCMGQNTKKILTKIAFVNNCFTLKHIFQIHISLDSPSSVLLCDEEKANCGNGKNEITLRFPSEQLYWSGTEKKIVQFICWKPDLKNQDFNATFKIDIQPFSQDLDGNAIKELKENVLMILHGGIQN